jgi:hypothetical protein
MADERKIEKAFKVSDLLVFEYCARMFLEEM